MTFAPTSISGDILAFCHQVAPDARPEYIGIAPELNCAESEYFGNVKQKVEREDGRIQFGWSISEWPGVALLAEHHAVYAPPSGQPWMDITPSRSENRRLFVPDDSAVYDFNDSTTRRDNKRFALKDDPLIQQFFTAVENFTAIRKSLPVGKVQVDIDTAIRLAEAKAEVDRLRNYITIKYPS